jgi:hypothetical protein
MGIHEDELAKTLLSQKGKLTSDICKKAVEKAAAGIARSEQEMLAVERIRKVRYFLLVNHGKVDVCLEEMRECLLQCREILRQSGNGQQQQAPKSGSGAKVP